MSDWLQVYDERDLIEEPAQHAQQYSGDDIGSAQLRQKSDEGLSTSSSDSDEHVKDVTFAENVESPHRPEPLRVNIYSIKMDSEPMEDWGPCSPHSTGIGTVPSSSNESEIRADVSWTGRPVKSLEPSPEEESEGTCSDVEKDSPIMYEPTIVDLPDSADDSEYNDELTYDGVPSTLPPKVGLPADSSSSLGKRSQNGSATDPSSQEDTRTLLAPRLRMQTLTQPSPDTDHVRTPHDSSLSAMSSQVVNEESSSSWRPVSPIVSTVIAAGVVGPPLPHQGDIVSISSPHSTLPPYSLHSVHSPHYPMAGSPLAQFTSMSRSNHLDVSEIEGTVSSMACSPAGSEERHPALQSQPNSLLWNESIPEPTRESSMFDESPRNHLVPPSQCLQSERSSTSSNRQVVHQPSHPSSVDQSTYRSQQSSHQMSLQQMSQRSFQLDLPQSSPMASFVDDRYAQRPYFGVSLNNDDQSSRTSSMPASPYKTQYMSDHSEGSPAHREPLMEVMSPSAGAQGSNSIESRKASETGSSSTTPMVASRNSFANSFKFQRADESDEDVDPSEHFTSHHSHVSNARSELYKDDRRDGDESDEYSSQEVEVRIPRIPETPSIRSVTGEDQISYRSGTHSNMDSSRQSSVSPSVPERQGPLEPTDQYRPVAQSIFQTQTSGLVSHGRPGTRLPDIPEAEEHRSYTTMRSTQNRRKFLADWHGDSRPNFYGHWTYSDPIKDISLGISIARRAKRPEEVLFVLRISGLGGHERGRSEHMNRRTSETSEDWDHDPIDEEMSDRDWPVCQEEARYQETRNLTGLPSADSELRDLYHHGTGTIAFYRSVFRGRWLDLVRPQLLLVLISRIHDLELPAEISIDHRIKVAASRQGSVNMNILMMFCGDRNNEVKKHGPRKTVISSAQESSTVFMATEGCGSISDFLCATLAIPGSCHLESEADSQAPVGLAGLFSLIKEAEPSEISPTTRAMAPASPAPGAELDELHRVPNIYAGLATRYFYWKPAGRAMGFFVLINFYSGKLLIFEALDDSAFGACDAFKNMLAYLRFPPGPFLISDSTYHKFIRLKATQKDEKSASWNQLETLFQHWLYGHKCSPWLSSLALAGPSHYVLDLQTIDYGSPYEGPDDLLSDHFIALQAILGLRHAAHVQIPVVTSASIRIWSPTRNEQKPNACLLFTIFRSAFWFLQDLHYCTANGDRMKATIQMNNTVTKSRRFTITSSDDQSEKNNTAIKAFWGARRDLQSVRFAQIGADRKAAPRHERESLKSLLKALKADSEKASVLAIQPRGHRRSHSRRGTRNTSPVKVLSSVYSGPVLAFPSDSIEDPAVSNILQVHNRSYVGESAIVPKIRIHRPIRQIYVPKEVWSSPEWHFPGPRNKLRAELEQRSPYPIEITGGAIPDLLLRPRFI